ncbi:MAG: amylo-alpha-1,6-glucosidase [Candidatus Ratteibacteria bacterium]|nr:amylo-alpha-1,6-glucosidase [Candidatus Ratteibacteria bacterium]
MENFEFSQYEWILTNSQGGYALGAANLLNHRKYHGLLVASDLNFKRTHLVSSVEEQLQTKDGMSFFLDANNYHNVIYPHGYKFMVEYFLRPYPSFLYSCNPPSSELLILKTIQMHPFKNICIVKYYNLGKIPFKLVLRPKFTLREHHSVHKTTFWDKVEYKYELTANTAKIASGDIEAYMSVLRGQTEFDPVIYRNVVYPTEIIRGYEGTEDLLSPFKIVCDIGTGEEETLIFADNKQDNWERSVSEAEHKYKKYPLPIRHPLSFKNEPDKILLNIAWEGKRMFAFKEYLQILELAMSEFITDNDLIAGFPWFSSWGRDTMISLEALKYLENGNEAACRILKKYSQKIKDGIIPNTLGEGNAGENYNSVDAPLWFGIRILEFWKNFDFRTKKIMIESIKQILANYLFNDSLPFHVDKYDGLISLHPDTGSALTWMDAKVHGEPVTPRYGKPVEINALWYNLLVYFANIAKKENIYEINFADNKIKLSEIDILAAKVKKSMSAFFAEVYFADRIENGKPNSELRPNYLIAFSLPFDVTSKEKMQAGYEIAKKKLLTPYGVRSLSPDHSFFRKKYMGNQRMRDLAYHQGTVWVWLLLAMAKTAVKIYSSEKEKLRKELEELVFTFRNGFMQGKMASIPELYNGEDPNLPKGAPAQCWSVAAIFLIEKMLLLEKSQ